VFSENDSLVVLFVHPHELEVSPVGRPVQHALF
jgi:hypothetical protein